MSKSLCDCVRPGISSCVLGGRKKGQYICKVDKAMESSLRRKKSPPPAPQIPGGTQSFNSNRDIKRRECGANFVQGPVH